jgi:uncharacterized protein YndB with AHSA1/START domain
MAPLVSTIEIARGPEEVFEYATDPLRFAEWQHDVVRVELLGNAQFSTTRLINGAERTMTQRITRDDPPRTWAADGIDGPIRPNATVTVEPLDGGARCRATFTLDFVGHGLGVPLAPLVRRLAARGAPDSYRNLKNLLEAPSGTRRGKRS